MNDDELKHLWQQQPLREPDLSPARLISAMQSKTTQLRRSLLARDVRELLACVIVGVIFGIYFFTNPAPVARLGALITVAGSIFIAWKILHARRTTPAAKPDATVIASLRAELHSVRTQSQLLRSVLWWYLLPLAVGTLVFVWGSPFNHLGFKICFTLFTLALDVFIYRLNQWARSKQLVPVEAQLESLLRSAETGEPLHETHVAGLRPIVLSMAAAGQVKPVEFKVAFWQIAIHGVPGIVGIWFFLMVGLTVNHQGWKTKEQAVETFPQTVPAAETNRYFFVARDVVDLFNSGDYAAVQKLFNPQMSEALPLPKATEFFTGLATQFGHIEKFDGPIGRSGELVSFRLLGQRGELTMKLALDANDDISGLIFRPAPSASRSSELLILRIFSWQHLLWLVPFFPAGLLYSWLLQKMTRRAVGISTLGVHLHKGLNLILWDEIKEVRPLRILNIRSLWLIRESGEKMIMPWTSLERQADLKAAVLSFAPTNHPIRKYLSLLRRS
jgi:hypothetical protein